MRKLAEVDAKLTGEQNSLKTKAVKEIDAAIDKWNGDGPITIDIPTGMGKITYDAIAQDYRTEGGFDVEIKPSFSSVKNETEPAKWVLTRPNRTDNGSFYTSK